MLKTNAVSKDVQVNEPMPHDTSSGNGSLERHAEAAKSFHQKGKDAEKRAAEKGHKDALPLYIQAGEQLIEAKPHVRHGHWEAWVKDECKISPNLAQKYMKVARHKEAIRKARITSLRKALRFVERMSKEAKPERPFRLLPVVDDLRQRAGGGELYPTIVADFASDDLDELRDRRLSNAIKKVLTPDGAHLHFWVGNPRLLDARDVLDAWQFTYRACLTWFKEHERSPTDFYSLSSEHLLFAQKGSLAFQSHDWGTWMQTTPGCSTDIDQMGRPTIFRDIIRDVSPEPILWLPGDNDE